MEGAPLPAKFVAAFKQPGAQLLNTDVGSREAHSWVTERLAHGPVKLGPAAATLVEAHLGEDLNRLGTLLVTLEAAYGTGARVGPDELAPYLGQPGSVPPWDLTDAIDRGEPEEALKLLHRLMEAGSRHPLVVLAILHRHFGNILRVQSPDIATEAQAAEALGIAKGRSTFPARKALDAARRLGMRGSGDAVIALADAELALKGKLDWGPEAVLEVLVARLCRLSRTARGAPVHAGARGHAAARGHGPALSRRQSYSALAEAVARAACLMRADLRLDAWLGWMMPRWAALSSFLTAVRRSSAAVSPPASMVVRADLTRVLTSDLAALLRRRLFSLVPIRFIWLLMFATG